MGQEAATRRGWRYPLSALALAGAPAPVVAPVLAGILAGAVVFFGAAVAQSLITGLALGVLVDLRGGARVLAAPIPGWSVGVVLSATVILLVLARELWWRHLAGRLAAIVVVGVLAGAGAASFSPPYLSGIGVATLPLLELLISGSQSTATFAFLGLVIGSIVVDRRGRNPG